jgi:hypothetical protein
MAVFSFRAECDHDVQLFVQNLTAKHLTFKIDVRADPLDLGGKLCWMGDMCANLSIDKSIDELRTIMEEQEDSHVMTRTLLEGSIEENRSKRKRAANI